MKRLLVTGTRRENYFENAAVSAGLYTAYRELVPEPTMEQVLLVHGNAKGIDKQAARLWQQLRLGQCEPHEADWKRYGNAAGAIRNQAMVDLGADLCVAFPDPGTSKGTYDCMNKARTAGIRVLVIGDDGLENPLW